MLKNYILCFYKNIVLFYVLTLAYLSGDEAADSGEEIGVGSFFSQRIELTPFIPPKRLSLDEVTRFFQGLTSLRHRAILMTAYAAGLRISEVLGLRVGDIDSRRMVIRLRQAKESKDRRDRLRVPHPGRCLQARENRC